MTIQGFIFLLFLIVDGAHAAHDGTSKKTFRSKKQTAQDFIVEREQLEKEQDAIQQDLDDIKNNIKKITEQRNMEIEELELTYQARYKKLEEVACKLADNREAEVKFHEKLNLEKLLGKVVEKTVEKSHQASLAIQNRAHEVGSVLRGSESHSSGSKAESKNKGSLRQMGTASRDALSRAASGVSTALHIYEGGGASSNTSSDARVDSKRLSFTEIGNQARKTTASVTAGAITMMNNVNIFRESDQKKK